ncbi:MAG: methionyl-tRNA formyltransferase [Syntrophobacteraceae bacterium]|nr:methionyl-tRNA formyltransferase [Syntrophobacteraceae bacterium]
MRIVVIGQAAFGEKTLEALLEKGEKVAGVFVPPDKPGSAPDPLKLLAASRDIRVIQPTTYKDDGVFELYRSLKPDLTILAFVTVIIPAKYFDAATLGAICYHPSLLPRHRGASAINWAIMMGDTQTGLTIFWPDGGIDTGPILLQRKVEIHPEDTTGSLYFNHLFPMGIQAILDSVDWIREGRAPRIPQKEEEATYEPPCDDRVARIDWNRSGQEIFNWIRGCDPQPGAYSYMKGEKIRFFGAKLISEIAPLPAGTITRIAREGIQIAVSLGNILVTKMRSPTEGKLPALELAMKKGWTVGDRFEPMA